ncbi:MAG: metallopeptidase TldD-related protein [Alphaproteobacteria bacterium]|nr:metallopeptidase TldD-related protein [Alphaproteobacteria bacterium]
MDIDQNTANLLFNELSIDEATKITTNTLQKLDDGELFLEYSISEHLYLDQNIIKSSSYNIDKGFCLRGISDDKSITAISDNITKKSLLDASENLKPLTSNSPKFLPKLLDKHDLYTKENPFENIDFDKKVKLLYEINDYVRKQNNKVSQASISLSGGWKVIYIIRADGFKTFDIRPQVNLRVNVVSKNNNESYSGSSGLGGRYEYEKLLQESNWKHISDEAVRLSLMGFDAKKAPIGEMPVVLGNSFSGVLLHEAVGHGLEGDFNRKGTSVFSNKIGEQVTAKGITIVDDGTINSLRGSINIDDEGTPSSRTVLIEDGILKNYMTDRINAKLMNKPLTGNGRRTSYKYSPVVRMTNTFMENGDKNPEEIISSVKNGIYAKSFHGGQVDITSGKFVFTTAEAYLIENGKITAPIKDATLIGSGIEVMNNVDMIGNDLCLDPGIGSCGKAGQMVPVGVGQPTIRIKKITVGGSK